MAGCRSHSGDCTTTSVADGGRHLPSSLSRFLLLGLSNGYFFYFFAVAVVLVVGAEMLVNVRSRSWILVDLAITATVMLAVTAPVITAYRDVREQQQLRRSRSEVVGYSADVWSYLDAPRNTLWSGLLPGDRPEAALLPGFGLVSLAVLGLGTASVGTGRRHTDTAAARLRIAGSTAWSALLVSSCRSGRSRAQAAWS